MSGTDFNNLTEIYESLTDWPKRLANETPFFRTLFDRHHVRTLADVACGTGRHAHLFHSWGLSVYASDLSPNMIARASAAQPPTETLRYAVRSFTIPPGPPASFDAVVCIGNSLSLAPDLAIVGQAVDAIFSATRPGGLVVLHVLNAQKFPPGPITWQKISRQPLPTHGDCVLFKGIHHDTRGAHIELVVHPITPNSKPLTHSVPFLPLSPADLEPFMQRNATTYALHGSHTFAPFTPASPDLIVVATK